MPRITVETEDFAYRITYEGRAGRRNPLGFFPDMEYEISAVEIGASKAATEWLHVDRQFIPAQQWTYLNEQVQDDMAEVASPEFEREDY